MGEEEEGPSLDGRERSDRILGRVWRCWRCWGVRGMGSVVQMVVGGKRANRERRDWLLKREIGVVGMSLF